MACGVFGGLMTKYYIRVGLLSGDNETSWKPAQPLMAGPLAVIRRAYQTKETIWQNKYH